MTKCAHSDLKLTNSDDLGLMEKSACLKRLTSVSSEPPQTVLLYVLQKNLASKTQPTPNHRRVSAPLTRLPSDCTPACLQATAGTLSLIIIQLQTPQ